MATHPTVLGLAADLAAERTTSRALVEAALARIADQAGEGARTFTKVYADQARIAADAQDQLRKVGYIASPLAGLPLSIKDLLTLPAKSLWPVRKRSTTGHRPGTTHRLLPGCALPGR